MDQQAPNVKAHRTIAAWKKWGTSEFLSELMPAIPPGAKLSPNSTVKPEMCGKVVGYQLDNGDWVGFKGKWSDERFTTLDEAKRYAKMGASIGMQGRNNPGVDIDVDHPIAQDINELTE